MRTYKVYIRNKGQLDFIYVNIASKEEILKAVHNRVGFKAIINVVEVA